MLFCRVTLVCVFVVACSGTETTSPTVNERTCLSIFSSLTDSHNIDECPDTAGPFSELISTNVYVPPTFLLPQTRNIVYPETGVNTHKITCIKVTNLDQSGQGGYAKIVSGGIGSYSIQILLTAYWGQALNFRIEVYGEV